MLINWRKYNRVLHRDLGYFFTGMVIIYSLSGIALNHRRDWNPNYIITQNKTSFQPTQALLNSEMSAILDLLKTLGEEKNYKSHYNPSSQETKIFLHNGASVLLNFETKELTIESIKKRPIFNQLNFLHYNPGIWWKWFSDIFCISLIIIAITGLFILKGKNGITHRGAWLVTIGIGIPLFLLVLYLSSSFTN